MAQRWMQAKELLARKNGRAVSGAGRATGLVKEDRAIGYVEPKLHPIKTRETGMINRTVVTLTPVRKQVSSVVVVLKANKPKPWRYTGADAFTC